MAVEVENADLGRRTASGLSWQVLASFIRVLTSFGFGIALARLLPPEDFGVIAIAYIVTGLVYVVTDVGLGAAIIQRSIITERHIRVCHTTSVTVAVLMTGGVLVSAEFIANIFGDSRVGPVLMVLSVASLLSGFSITSGALLVRRLAFRTSFGIELLASTAGYGGVAVAMAVAGYGYWSLVGGTLAQATLSSGLSYYAERHTLRPLVARPEIRDLIRFGSGASLTSIASYLALKGDYLVVGRLMNATSLAFYSRAYTLTELPLVFLGSALSRVLFPAASRVQNDVERFRRAYLTTFSISTAVSLPLSLAVALLAPEIIVTLYGDAWAPAVPLLRILCLFGMFRMTYNTAAAFLRARGQIYRLLLCAMAYGVLVVGCSWWAISIGGLAGVAWSVGGAISGMWLLVVAFANRAADVSLRQFGRELARVVVPGLGTSVGLAALVAGMRTAGVPPLLILAVSSIAISAALVATLVYQSRRIDHPTINALLERARAGVALSRTRLRRMVYRTASQ